MSIGREPALILIGVLGPLAAFGVSFLDGLGVPMQTAIIAVCVAVAGILTAVVVGGDKLAPAILGLAQAVATFALAYGFALTPEQQAGWLTIVGIFVAAFVRTQVVAPVDDLGSRHAR